MNKKLLTIMFGIVLVLGLAACSGGDKESGQGESQEGKEGQTEEKQEKNAEESSSDIPDPVAVVNGEEISKDRFTQQYKAMKKQYEQMGMNVDQNKEQLQKSIVNSLVDSELLVQYAKKSGIKVDDKKVEKKYNEIEKQIKSEEQMQEFLKMNNMSSKEELKPRIRESLQVEKYVEENTEQAEVTEKELKAEYDKMVKQMEQQAEQTGKEQEIPKYEDVKPQVEQQLKKSKEQEQISKLVEKLRADSKVKINI
ncbi:SurA N-terminal domain-containing protein [Thalassobacillus devorans]|uniref:SurA N-terminal domain-containing protein n=1 Tax=Thalassobacillus devorans TaxID=279813 RepID=UPI00048AE326|nr:SurA N-terminal domain-containing protein [Thalassobacillus devorans]